jgi:predicted RNA-binding Zn ribbon-like protein
MHQHAAGNNQRQDGHLLGHQYNRLYWCRMVAGSARHVPRHSDRRQRESQTHRLIAGDVSLDFANTLNGHGLERPHEYLHDPEDLILWSVHAGLVTSSAGRNLLGWAAAKPDLAQRVWRDAIGLREAIFGIFHALALGNSPRERALQTVSRQWKEGWKHRIVMPAGSGYAVAWDDQPTLRSIPRQISEAAINLLTSEDSRRVRACSGETCDWLFIDNSRNHLRLWCSMDQCGNRAKMRRRRIRSAQTG